MNTDDSILIIREHMIDVCMDLVAMTEEDAEDIREDFTEMVDILLEATDLTVVGVDPEEEGTTFQCTMKLATPK